MRKNLKKLFLLMAVVVTAMVCLVFSAGAESYGVWEGYNYYLSDEGIMEISGYSGKSTDLVIPKEIKGKKVTSIGGYAFSNTPITSVVLPDSITEINLWAFFECNSLEYISMSDNIEYISYGILSGTKVKSIYLPKSIEYIGSSGLSGIKDIYYQGNEKQWDDVFIEEIYQYTDLKVHYNHTHTYKTETINGKAVDKCICGKVNNSLINGVKNTEITLSKTTYTYNGKEQKPSVTVKDSKGNVLKNGTDYTVKYEKGRIKTGRYNVKITFKGKYSGTKTLKYTIAPKATSKITVVQSTKAIKLTWDKVTGATGYRVYQYNSETKKYEKIKTLSGTTYRIENLKSGTTYKFRVKAYKKDDGTIWGAAKDITTVTKPVAPKITAVASTAKGRAAVAWSNVAGETGYELWASTKKDSGYKKIVTAKADVTKGVRTGLVSGRTYYFKVRAYKTVGNTVVYSAWSNTTALKVK